MKPLGLCLEQNQSLPAHRFSADGPEYGLGAPHIVQTILVFVCTAVSTLVLATGHIFPIDAWVTRIFRHTNSIGR